MNTSLRSVSVDQPTSVAALPQRVRRGARGRRQLANVERRFQLAFEAAPTGMIIVDVETATMTDINERFAAMLGRTVVDLMGTTWRAVIHPDDWELTQQYLHRLADGVVSQYRMDQRFLKVDSSEVWASCDINVLRDDRGKLLAFCHIEDVSDRRAVALRLQWAATHDDLTGLHNRGYFLDQLRSRLETGEIGSTAMLFIDLDNFKVVNDSLGHAVGDDLLCSMGKRLQSVVRPHDLLSRFGGDEFLVLLDSVDRDVSVFDVAERLRHEISQTFLIDGTEFVVTASIGVAMYDREGLSALELMRDADAAVYRAKARGRNCVEMFAPGAHESTVLALRTTNELRRGLERNEFVPYYQPIIDLESSELTGFEVLARWRHPTRGLLLPDQFLPLAEEIGLISELGGVMLRESLLQLSSWREQFATMGATSMAVNVSARQLLDPKFLPLVGEALQASGIDPDLLWLEITETALMSDVKSAGIALRALRDLGVHLSVDDFGTGYSSLTYLRRFPVEAIKVDRSFVDGLGTDAEDSSIVEAVINLGKSLGLMVVAEGVETPLHLSRLRAVGCDRGQGFLFGRPRPAGLIEADYGARQSPNLRARNTNTAG